MNPFPRQSFRTSLFVSLAIVAGLSLLQILAAGGPSLFGKSVTGLAAGVIQFYPEIAFGEVFKVHFFVFALVFSAVHYYRMTSRILAASRWRKGVLYASPVLAWALVSMASLVEYPALYESTMSRGWSGRLFQLSHAVSPVGLQAVAMLIALFPVFLLVARRVRSGGTGQLKKLGVVMAIVFLMRGSADPTNATIATGSDLRNLPPDILFIGIDSLRSDRLEKPNVLPELNRLRGDESTASFDDHIVGIPRTFPSWIEILQGRYSAKTGIRHMFPGFTQREGKFEGLVTRLKNHGYQTTVISDFAGDIFPRFDAGFDDVIAPSMTLGNMIRQSVDLMFPLYLPLTTSSVGRPFFSGLKTAANYSDPRHLAEEAINRMNAPGRGKSVLPKLTTIFFSTAHFPYAAPYPYYKMFSDPTYDGPFYFQKNPALNGDESGLRDSDMRQVNNLYDGALRGVDDAIGAIIADLKKTGKWERTLIVVTADHGEDLFDGTEKLHGHGEHLRGENVLKVPLLIKIPAGLLVTGKFPGKSKEPTPFVTRSIDIAPTVLGLVGLENISKRAGADSAQPEEAFEGRDLSGWVLRGEAGPATSTAYAETEIWFSRTGNGKFQKQRLDYPGISGLLTFDAGYSGEVILNPKYENVMITSRHRSLISSQWKLIYIPTPDGVQWELYNRREDPLSLNNQFDLQPALARSMQSDLLAKIEELEPRSRLIGGYVVPR